MGTDSRLTNFRPNLTGDASSLLVTASGLATSLLVVGIDWVFKHNLGLNFPSIMHWFIIPTGALCTGAGCCSIGILLWCKTFAPDAKPGTCV